MNLGLPELLIVLLIILVLFGASRLPKLARSVGEAGHELRKGLDSGSSKKSDDKKPDKDS